MLTFSGGIEFRSCLNGKKKFKNIVTHTACFGLLVTAVAENRADITDIVRRICLLVGHDIVQTQFAENIERLVCGLIMRRFSTAASAVAQLWRFG